VREAVQNVFSFCKKMNSFRKNKKNLVIFRDFLFAKMNMFGRFSRILSKFLFQPDFCLLYFSHKRPETWSKLLPRQSQETRHFEACRASCQKNKQESDLTL
jgi:hypothetical protein